MNELVELKKNNPLITWLFNPFTYIAGPPALIIGLIGIMATSLIGSLGNVHCDGVLDMHIGAKVPVWFFIAEGFIDWFSLAVLLAIAGLIFSKSSFRMIVVRARKPAGPTANPCLAYRSRRIDFTDSCKFCEIYARNLFINKMADRPSY